MTMDRRAPLQADILGVLAIGPRTCHELAIVVGTSQRCVRHALGALSDDGCIRLAGSKLTPDHHRHAYLFAAVKP